MPEQSQGASPSSTPQPDEAPSFQRRVEPWMSECFGDIIQFDRTERNHRFIEEALELVQACGGTREDCHMLVDYVFDRPTGEKVQEAGGVMVTLAALCLAQGMDMHEAGETELRRIWGKVDVIREKQKNKPRNSPLPQAAPERESVSRKALMEAIYVGFERPCIRRQELPKEVCEDIAVELEARFDLRRR